MPMIVPETGQPDALQATRHTVVGGPPDPAILNETEILQRAAHHFRLRGKSGTATDFPGAIEASAHMAGEIGSCP